jgi:hypothetical protein
MDPSCGLAGSFCSFCRGDTKDPSNLPLPVESGRSRALRLSKPLQIVSILLARCPPCCAAGTLSREWSGARSGAQSALTSDSTPLRFGVDSGHGLGELLEDELHELELTIVSFLGVAFLDQCGKGQFSTSSSKLLLVLWLFGILP